ncbi:MAG: hypothetical protein ACOCYW_02430 [Roseicyclus sp.]
MTRDRGRDRSLTAPAGGMAGTLEPPARTGMAEGVVCLHHDEPTRFDAERLEDLCLTLGEAQAETEVAEALKRIATTIDQLDWLISMAGPELLKLCLGSLARDAGMIGMTTLSSVAEAASNCVDRDDAIARAAAFARLRRIGERSILAIWDLDDIV